MHTALLAAATATALVGIASPANAAAPTVTTLGTAFTSIAAADGETFFYADGYDHAGGGGGVVDVFGASVECSLPESGTPAAFTTDGTSSASLTGTLAVECWDFASERGGAATITADLHWTATGAATRTPLSSPRLGCTGFRYTAPAVVTGSVRLHAPFLALDVTAVPDDRPAEIAQTVSRCR